VQAGPPPAAARPEAIALAEAADPAPSQPAAPSTRDSRRGVHIHSDAKRGDSVSTLSWSDDQASADVVIHGEVRWNADFTDVESISDGGSIEMSIRKPGHRTRAEIVADPGGLSRTLTVDGATRAWDPAWFTSFLDELDRHTAFAVEARFPSLYREKGARGVLDRVASNGSDYAASRYLMRLIDADPLDEPTTLAVLDQLSRFTGDYETAQALVALAAKAHLASDAERAAYLKVCNKLRGDYERSRVLRALTDRADLSPALVKDVLASIAGIRGDYEESENLVALTQRLAPDAREFLAAAATVSGAYEHARVLKALVAAETLDERAQIEVVHQTARLGDYESSQVLIALAQRAPPTGEALREYEAAANRLGDYSRGQVLAALHPPARRR
jgi:hypothetical protein